MISDRIKHNSILAATSILPKSLRIPVRYRWLSGLQRAKAKRADVLIIVHPKAGGTWFRVMFSRVYQKKYGLPENRVVKSDEFHRRMPALPRFLITNGHYSYEGEVGKLFAPLPDADLKNKKVIFLARHPCDIAVSWYIQFTKRTKAYKRELISDSLQQPIRNRDSISRWDYVMHPELGLSALIEYHNTWYRNVSALTNGLVIRYEDLRSEPVETLKRVMEFLGEDASDEAIREAVEFASFDNLRKLEKTNYFSNAGLRLRDTKDPDMLKVRRGKVGGFRDDLTSVQSKKMDDLIRSRITPNLGYSDLGRAECIPANSIL